MEPATASVTYSDSPDVVYPHCDRHAGAFRPPCDEECGEPAGYFVPTAMAFWCLAHIPGSTKQGDILKDSFPQSVSQDAGIAFLDGDDVIDDDFVVPPEDVAEAAVLGLLDNLLLATMINARFAGVHCALALAQTEHMAPGLITLPAATRQFAETQAQYRALASMLYGSGETAPTPESAPADTKAAEVAADACQRCEGSGRIGVALPTKTGAKVRAQHVCPSCGGTGKRPEERAGPPPSTEGYESPHQPLPEAECGACKGKGKIVGADLKLQVCPTCSGRKVVSVLKRGRTPYPDEDGDDDGEET